MNLESGVVGGSGHHVEVVPGKIGDASMVGLVALVGLARLRVAAAVWLMKVGYKQNKQHEEVGESESRMADGFL